MLKRLVKTPKIYFYDTGLVCFLTRWSNAKTYYGNGKEPYMYYYRDKDAKEIDIVLEHDGVLNPIEIKKQQIQEVN